MTQACLLDTNHTYTVSSLHGILRETLQKGLSNGNWSEIAILAQNIVHAFCV
jgi:hypothetical protein